MPLTTAIHTGRAATITETTTFYTLPNCDVEAASERAGNKSYAKPRDHTGKNNDLGKKARQRTSNHVIRVGLPIFFFKFSALWQVQTSDGSTSPGFELLP